MGIGVKVLRWSRYHYGSRGGILVVVSSGSKGRVFFRFGFARGVLWFLVLFIRSRFEGKTYQSLFDSSPFKYVIDALTRYLIKGIG